MVLHKTLLGRAFWILKYRLKVKYNFQECLNRTLIGQPTTSEHDLIEHLRKSKDQNYDVGSIFHFIKFFEMSELSFFFL